MSDSSVRAPCSILRDALVTVLFLSFGTGCVSREGPDASGALSESVLRTQSRSIEVVPRGGDTLLARLLTTRTPGPFPMIEFRAELTNGGDAPIDISFGDCALRIRLYPAEGDGGLQWDSARYIDSCTLQLSTGAIDPGDSLAPDAFAVRLSLDRLLSDTVPQARYRVRADLEVIRRGESVTEDTLRLPGTMLDLTPGIRHEGSV